MEELIWSFVPWLVFLGSVHFVSFSLASAASAVAAIVVLGRAVIRRRVHLLDVVSTVYFLAIAAFVALVRPTDLHTLARYAQGGSHAMLTLVAFGSVLVGHPFTEPYARQQVPKALWHSAEFRAANRHISLAFGLAFMFGTASMFVAGAIGATGLVQTLLRVVVPVGALAVAYKYVGRQAGQQPASI